MTSTTDRPRRSTVMFDLDGTLTDSAPGILASLSHALHAVGHPPLDAGTQRKFLGPPLRESFRTLCGFDAATTAHAITAYREFFTEHGIFDNAVFPGIRALLESLRDKGFPLAVATSKAQPYAERILDHFALTPFFVAVVGSELDGRRATKADVIEEAVRQLGLATPPDAVMVGDREHDVIGAAAHGMSTIGVLWGYGTASELTEAGARHLVAQPDEITRLLDPITLATERP